MTPSGVWNGRRPGRAKSSLNCCMRASWLTGGYGYDTLALGLGWVFAALTMDLVEPLSLVVVWLQLLEGSSYPFPVAHNRRVQATGCACQMALGYTRAFHRR